MDHTFYTKDQRSFWNGGKVSNVTYVNARCQSLDEHVPLKNYVVRVLDHRLPHEARNSFPEKRFFTRATRRISLSAHACY